MKVTIYDHNGEASRVNLPQAFWTGHQNISTGIWLEALFVGKKTGRMFSKQFSQWVRADGSQTGDFFTEHSESEFLRLCDLAGVDPPEKIQAQEV